MAAPILLVNQPPPHRHISERLHEYIIHNTYTHKRTHTSETKRKNQDGERRPKRQGRERERQRENERATQSKSERNKNEEEREKEREISGFSSFLVENLSKHVSFPKPYGVTVEKRIRRGLGVVHSPSSG